MLKQATNYLFSVYIRQVKQNLTAYLVQVDIFSDFKTVHSHYNSSGSQHSIKIIIC